MTVQDQYTSTFVKTQETWAGVVESLTDNMKETFSNVDESLSVIDPIAAIDQVFDYWEKALGTQREAAHQLLAATVTASGKVRTQAEAVGAAVKAHVESVQAAVAEQTPSN